MAAEISVASPLVTFPYDFIIGDDDMTESINDYPGYSNPALEAGTAYTAFIRVFPPAAEVSTRTTPPGANGQDQSPLCISMGLGPISL